MTLVKYTKPSKVHIYVISEHHAASGPGEDRRVHLPPSFHNPHGGPHLYAGGGRNHRAGHPRRADGAGRKIRADVPVAGGEIPLTGAYIQNNQKEGTVISVPSF